MVEDFGLLQSHAFGIQLPQKPGIIPTFHSFLGSKNKESNSINWTEDFLQNGLGYAGTWKNPCFWPEIGKFLRRTPTEILPSIMGMQRAFSER